MVLTVSEAAAVLDLLHWLGVTPPDEQIVDDDRAGSALELLTDHAGKTLRIHLQPGEARQAIAQQAARHAGATPEAAGERL